MGVEPAHDAERFREGAVVAGRFRLDRLLGKGGMGQVWAVTHQVTGRKHALKLLNVDDIAPVLRRRFLREARAASLVEHPNVITIHDIFELEDGTPVMVMDLLEGETLRERLDREEQLTPADAAALLLPVVSAVGAAHALGIVHRDLKPENIFLCTGAVKVLDFGIAKLIAPEADGELVTKTGQILGTPAYMAPEQHTGEGDIDHRADVWALGVILYEALSGGRPFESNSVARLVAAILDAGVPPLEEVAPETPTDLAKLVGRMLAREPADRPSDLREVASVLAAHTGVTVSTFEAARQQALPSQPVARSQDRPAAISLTQPLTSLDAITSFATPIARRRHVWWAALVVMLVVVGGVAASYFAEGDSKSIVDAPTLAVPAATSEPTQEPPAPSMPPPAPSASAVPAQPARQPRRPVATSAAPPPSTPPALPGVIDEPPP